MIVTIAGGVGGSKFIKGLSSCNEDITAVINTGDDFERFGLYISPDIDINLYTLANVIHEQGWGFKNETYSCQGILSEMFEQESWFNLGDKDLATHIYRSYLLQKNKTLSEVTKTICEKWKIPITIIPMSDQRVATYIDTPDGIFHFQEYLIKRRMSDKVMGIHFKGSENALPSPTVLKSIEEAEMILVAPSNPLVSIGPILSIPGIKKAIQQSSATVIAVSPIVAGDVIKGPAARMFRDLEIDVSPLGVLECYKDILDGIVIDEQDEHYQSKLEKRNVKVLVTDTIMNSNEKKTLLAKQVVNFARTL